MQLVKDELQDSMAESQVDREDTTSKRDERVLLIQDSCPNYAKIDHFANGQDRNRATTEDEEVSEKALSAKKAPHIQQPNMNELIRKVREEISKEYDDKYQASLEEIDLYKSQLE